MTQPSPWNVADVILRQAARRPDAIALSTRQETCTYGLLDTEVRRRALDLTVATEQPVAVVADRSISSYLDALAALLAGGCAVLVDPDYPEARQRAILKQSGAVAMQQRQGRAAALQPSLRDGPARLALMLFTSGSTGSPKGVQLTHGNILSFVLGGDPELRHAPKQVVAHVLSSSFDAVIPDVVGALCNGATAHITSPGALKSVGHLLADLEGVRIDTISLTSSLLHQIHEVRPSALSRIPNVWFGGEAARADVVEYLAQQGSRMVHHYGPTECTSIATVHVYESGTESDGTLPIGRPLTTVDARLVDLDGDIKELALAGPQVARGFVADPRETASRFLPDPDGPSGARMYRTGDQVRLTKQGLRFLGRQDAQVKVRGYRVELAEVRSTLCRLPEVHDALASVTTSPDGQGAQVVAHVVGQVDPARLREYCLQHLPEYMVPAGFAVLDEWPTSPNNKIDVARLPRVPLGQDRLLPAPESLTKTQTALLALWRDVLQVEDISLDDNFFALGGYSLLAARVINQVERTFGRRVPLRRLFEAPTARALAELLDAELPTANGAKDASGQLTPEQRELWFLQQLNPDGSDYNSAMAYLFTAHRMDRDRLETALRRLVRRNDALRAAYVSTGGKPSVEYRSSEHTSPVRLTWEQHPEVVTGVALDEWLAERRSEPFDLADPPLLRAHVRSGADGNAAILLVAHHIALDAISAAGLARQLGEEYDAGQDQTRDMLFADADSYARAAGVRVAEVGCDAYRDVLESWRNRLDGAPSAIELPMPQDPVRRGSEPRSATDAEILFDREVTEALHAKARTCDTTPYVLLLTLVGAALSMTSGSEDMVVATPVSGRDAHASGDTVGLFTRLLPLRLQVSWQRPLNEQIKDTHARVVAAMRDQDAAFDDIVRVARPGRSPRTPRFFAQIVVNMVDVPEPALSIGDEVGQPLPVPSLEARVPLALIARYVENRLAVQALTDPRYLRPYVGREVLDMMLRLAPRLVDDAGEPADRTVGEWIRSVSPSSDMKS